jgi:tight adherence protein B
VIHGEVEFFGPAVLALLGLGTLLYFAMRAPDGPLYVRFAAYLVDIDRDLRATFSKTSVKRIIASQVIAALGAVALALYFEEPLVLLAIPLVVSVSTRLRKRQAAQRVRAIEEQLAGWLTMLANTLRSTPALGDAVGKTAPRARSPLREDLDYIVKQMRLGMTVAAALEDMAKRLQSRIVTGTCTVLVVGQSTGGDLPHLLDSSAASLREITRLEGVVRSRTAQARAGVAMVVAVPILTLIFLHFAMPGLLPALLKTDKGMALVTSTLSSWIIGFVLLRSRMRVSI